MCELQKLKIHRFEAAGYRLLQDPQTHFSKKRDSRTEKGSMISDLTRLPKDYCIAYGIIVFSAGLPLKDLCRDSFYLDFWVFTVTWCKHFGNKNYIGLRQSTSASIFFCKTSICKHTTIELCMCLCVDVSFLGELFQPKFAQLAILELCSYRQDRGGEQSGLLFLRHNSCNRLKKSSQRKSTKEG